MEGGLHDDKIIGALFLGAFHKRSTYVVTIGWTIVCSIKAINFVHATRNEVAKKNE